MDYEGFKEKFVEDLKEKLEDVGIEASVMSKNHGYQIAK